MPNYDNLTSIARDAILQINDFKQAHTILENVPNAIFEDVSLIALSYYAEAVKYMMTFSNAMQKLYCIAQLERITVSICRDTLLRFFSEEKKQYTQDELYGIIDVLTDIASVYFDQSELDTAMNIQKTIDLLKVYQSHPDAPELDDSFFDLVNTYIAKYEFNNAIDRLLEAMKAREEKFGQGSAETASVYFRLADVYHKMGKYDEAVDDYEVALEIQKNILGLRHPDTASTLNNLARVFQDMGDYDKAWEHFNKALHIREEVLGKEHPDTAETYNNIGALCIFMGNLPQALNYSELARTILEKVLGKDHPNTAQTYNNIALVYDVMGDYNKALEYYKKVIPVFETVHGSEHPETAIAYSNIAGVYRAMGDYNKALEYYHKALSIRETVLSTEHPDTSKTYNNIADVYRAMGDYDKALEYYHKALAICEKVLGTEHPDTAMTYNNIALVYRAIGDYNKALEYYHKALSIRETVLSTEHPDTSKTYNNIADVYRAMGDYDKALEYYHKALAICEKVLGTEHPYTVSCYDEIAVVYKSMGNYVKAREILSKAYEIRIKVLGMEHPSTITTFNNIAVLDERVSEPASHMLHPFTFFSRKTDNQDYLDHFYAPLFLEECDSMVTLASMYVSPHLNGRTESIADCIMQWFHSKTRKNCMLLLGNTGVGKSTVVSKIIADANNNAEDKEYKFTADRVLVIALRNYCDKIDLNKNASEILTDLFEGYTLDELENKLLILDGLDEVCMLRKGFDGYIFLEKMSNLKRGFHVFITSCELKEYISDPELISGLQIERIQWKEQEVEKWCDKYCSAKKEKKAWCDRFIKDYKKLIDRRHELLCVPLNLYIFGSNEINLSDHKSVGSFYEHAFRIILYRSHFAGQGDYTNLNNADKTTRLIAWQYTKEIAYQMFLLDTLTLAESNDLNNIYAKGLKNAKTRTITVLREKYDLYVQDNDLEIRKELGICPFMTSNGVGGISFVHKTVYEYFTAVKLYEDYFAKFNKSYFNRKRMNDAAEDVMNTAIEAFRYKAIPPDIFQYLCSMRDVPFSDTYDHLNSEQFDCKQFEVAFIHALENGILDTLTMKAPTQEYLYRSSSEINMNPINKQIGRAYHSLLCFLTGHGFRNDTNSIICKQILQILGASDQYIDMNSWQLSRSNLREAFLRSANLSKANLQEADLRGANMRGADLSHADLKSAYLIDVDLICANLNGADLQKADLKGADLRGADLSNVHLENADLRDANLRGTNFRGALYGTDSTTLTLFPEGFDPKKYGMIAI